MAVSQALGERVPVLWHAGLNSPVLLLLYLLALRSVFEHERGQAQTQVRGRAGTADPAAHAPDPTDQRTVRQEWMRFGMAALGLTPYMKDISGLQDESAGKKTEIGRRQLRELGLTGADVVLVGDMLTDAHLAEALGADCVLVLDGVEDVTSWKELSESLTEDGG